MKKWKCSVCGYIHIGDEPPEECPRCGADRSQFFEITEEESILDKTETTESTASSGMVDAVIDLISKHHLHPISVHIPNGVLPLSVLFTLISVLFGFEGLGSAAFYNMFFVVLTMPVVLVSGFIDWKKNYGGTMHQIFITKMICGALVVVLAVLLVIWRILDPDVAGPASTTRWMYVGAHFIALAPAVLAGYLGGKLVFREVSF
jgi:uncharacterized membrane protein